VNGSAVWAIQRLDETCPQQGGWTLVLQNAVSTERDRRNVAAGLAAVTHLSGVKEEERRPAKRPQRVVGRMEVQWSNIYDRKADTGSVDNQ